MSHEIRTPMNTVIGTLSTLRHTSLDADQREQVALVDKASVDLLALIDDILDITRIETGNLRTESVPCDLEELGQQIWHAVAPQAVTHGIELCIAPLPPTVPRLVKCDPLRLRQVLLNLLSNAIKFTESGHVRLDVSAERHASGTCTLRLSVADTGIGIPAHLQERLFAAFAQADMSTTRLHGGAGLGLHICKGIVTLMGGDIALESTPGQGSRFDVTLVLEPLERRGGARAPERPSRRLHYIDHYAPFEQANRRALALAGIALEEIAPPSASSPVPMLVSVPNHVLQAFDAGLAEGFAPPDTASRRLALVDRITPDIKHRLESAGFDAHVLRTPHPGELRDAIEQALCEGFDVPVRRPAAGTDRATLPLATAPARRRVRVLAIDDQGMNLDLLARYFTHLGVEGTFARTDAEAARELAVGRFDLVLLDLHMPGRDGFEIARELRGSDSPNRREPLVALTADAYADSRARALANGFDGVLTKPVTIDQVRSELERRIPAPGPDPMPQAKAPIVSIAACAAGMLDNHEWAVGAIGTYRDEVPLHVGTLREAIARRDRHALLEAAHALKGVSDICRVKPVSTAARTLEHAAESEHWHMLEALGDELVALLGRAAEECTRELERAAEPSL